MKMEYYTPTFIKKKMDAIKRVRALHIPDQFNPMYPQPIYCRECGGVYPCPTIEAVDGK